MEPITLCGLVIVMFGLWVEFEPRVMAVIRWIGASRLCKDAFASSAAQRPVYVRRMPICVAKGLNY